mmetsp:Transcript_29146/g.93206  ORF Transcript_29146/g.93206 Transcript_29146/m.93206 type:complete len:277 (+) Transcript_29146:175-1005(+)
MAVAPPLSPNSATTPSRPMVEWTRAATISTPTPWTSGSDQAGGGPGLNAASDARPGSGSRQIFANRSGSSASSAATDEPNHGLACAAAPPPLHSSASRPVHGSAAAASPAANGPRDVLTSAKALGGGVPIGAMMCKASCDVLTPGTHASTFGGNPLACAAANAVLQAIEDDGVLANVNARSAQLVSGLEALRSKREGVIAEVRGWGLLLGVELTAECGFTAAQLTAAAMRNGLLTVPAGEKVLRLVPPLIVSAEQADRAVGILDASMAELMAGQQE